MNASTANVVSAATADRIQNAIRSTPTIGNLVELTIRSRICGIYFLMWRDEVVYVGQSEDLERRVGQHLDDPTKRFDCVLYASCPPTLLDHYERHLIELLRPRYNSNSRRLSTSRFVDSELGSHPEGQTLEELFDRAKELGVRAQTQRKLRANISKALADHPAVFFSEDDLRFHIEKDTRALKVQ